MDTIERAEERKHERAEATGRLHAELVAEFIDAAAREGAVVQAPRTDKPLRTETVADAAMTVMTEAQVAQMFRILRTLQAGTGPLKYIADALVVDIAREHAQFYCDTLAEVRGL